MSDLKETWNIKFVARYEDTPQKLLSPITTSKIAHLGPKIPKKTLQIRSKSKVRIERKIEIKSKYFFCYMGRPKNVFEP